jgi:hypothetical protein
MMISIIVAIDLTMSFTARTTFRRKEVATPG